MNRARDTLSSTLWALASLPEESTHAHLLKQKLKGLRPTETARLFEVAFSANTEKSDLGARRLKLLLVDPEVLKDSLGEERFKLTYLASLKLRLKRVSRLFTDLPPLLPSLKINGKTTGKDDSPPKADKAKEALALDATAAQLDPSSKTRESALKSASTGGPSHMKALLDKDKLTEEEVVRIASTRPASPETLKLVATHRRWRSKYHVISAVVFNPYTQPRVSLALLEFLRVPELKAAATSTSLHPQVVMTASEILSEGGVPLTGP